MTSIKSGFLSRYQYSGDIYFRSRGDVVVIFGQCFQGEIAVSLFVSWFLTFVHPGPIGEV